LVCHPYIDQRKPAKNITKIYVRIIGLDWKMKMVIKDENFDNIPLATHKKEH